MQDGQTYTPKRYWGYRAHRHPYQKDVPKEYHDSDRWFLLDTNLDPPRPWDMHTNIPVLKPCPGTR